MNFTNVAFDNVIQDVKVNMYSNVTLMCNDVTCKSIKKRKELTK